MIEYIISVTISDCIVDCSFSFFPCVTSCFDIGSACLHTLLCIHGRLIAAVMDHTHLAPGAWCRQLWQVTRLPNCLNRSNFVWVLMWNTPKNLLHDMAFFYFRLYRVYTIMQVSQQVTIPAWWSFVLSKGFSSKSYILFL